MNAYEKSNARMVFQNKILKSNGQAFEDLFTDKLSDYRDLAKLLEDDSLDSKL